MYRSSFSQHNSFHICPRMWFFQKVLKIQIPQDMCYANGGSLVHKLLEDYYSKKVIEKEEIKKNFDIGWEKYNLHKSKISLKKPEYWIMVLNGIELNLDVTSTELKVYYDDVLCYMDIAETNKDEIRDWKSSTRREENEIEYTQQLMLYAWVYYRKFGRIPTKCTVHYLKYQGEKGKLSFSPTIEDIEKIAKWYNRIRKQMEESIEKKELPDKCEECFMFCQYKDICDNYENRLIYKLHINGNYITVAGHISDILNKQLTKKFSYELKDAFFIKKAKPQANTTITFWNSNSHKLPIGFLDGLKKTLSDYAEYKKKELTLKIIDERTFNNTRIEMPNKFINGKILRDYQIAGVSKFLNHKVGMLELGTGAGKTEISIDIIRQLGYKTLFIVDKVELLRQTKKRIEEALGIEVGVIGASESNIKDITIATIQTLIKNKKKYLSYLNSIRFVIFDECFSKGTKILLSDMTEKTIEEVFNDNNINEVMSYNEKKQIFEPKKIFRKIKQPMFDKWWHLNIEDELGKQYKLILTGNHKIWTKKGYKQVKDLDKNDILKVYLKPIKYKCEFCGKLFNSKDKKGACVIEHKHPGLKSKLGKKSQQIIKEKRKNKNYDIQFRENMCKGIKNAKKHNKYWEGKKRMGLKRRGKNNPVFNNGVIEKIKNTQKNNFQNLSEEKQKEQIIRWNKSKRIMPTITKPEQIIIDMNINNLEYNNKYKYMYKFKNGKWKIPDFKVKNENKVIEVSDFERWRTYEERSNYVKWFKEIDVDCLYLDKDELYNNYNITKKKIEKFCYNHKAKVISIKESRSNPQKTRKNYKYNLEVEDNHNFIANKVLVSNCHKVAAKSYWKIAHSLLNTEYRLGLSGTAFRDDGNDMYIQAITGNVIMDLGTKFLIEKGWLIKPDIIFIDNFLTELEIKNMEDECKLGLINETEKYSIYYSRLISTCAPRNKVISDIAISNNNSNKKTLILVKLVDHGKTLEQEIPDSRYLHGGTGKKERQTIMEDFVNGKLNVLIGTISIFSEGIDIPILDSVINAAGNKGDVKTIQILGRVLRKILNKKGAKYYDFYDRGKFIISASLARMRALKREGHNVVVKNVEEL